MMVVEGRNKLTEEIIELLSFPGQTILHLVTKMESGQGYQCSYMHIYIHVCTFTHMENMISN